MNFTKYLWKKDEFYQLAVLITAALLLICGTRAYLSSLDGGFALFFGPETVVESFIHLIVLLCKVFTHYFSK